MGVLRDSTLNRRKVPLLDPLRDWADRTSPDRAMIHLNHWRDLRPSATEEELVTDVELTAVN